MTQSTISNLFLNAVKHHPKNDLNCRMPHSFGVIRHLSDVNTDNLQKTLKDIQKGLYWTRNADLTNSKNLNVSWPLVALSFDSVSWKGMGSSRMESCYKISMYVLDILVTEEAKVGKSNNPCGLRNSTEIQEMTQQIGVNVLNYLTTVQRVSVNGGPEEYMAKPYADFVRSEGHSVNVITPKVRFLKTFENDDFESYGSWNDSGRDDMFGTQFRFDICVNACPETGYNFEPAGERVFKTDCC